MQWSSLVAQRSHNLELVDAVEEDSLALSGHSLTRSRHLAKVPSRIMTLVWCLMHNKINDLLQLKKYEVTKEALSTHCMKNVEQSLSGFRDISFIPNSSGTLLAIVPIRGEALHQILVAQSFSIQQSDFELRISSLTSRSKQHHNPLAFLVMLLDMTYNSFYMFKLVAF
ncbi:hypothetical protein RJ641_001027 [Dillenia turbinata]|uniref:Uncharacterized protein n=1 Tax=Dillenia turbinata TaxID=194707 RepID=A0AAN8WD23_9MAGN